ncbi:SelT/SelW/SelH family protein [Symbioplanes lichenis]|uniref:SelT/SelW/SelH family protein n=1 Tax=Symbioplanes lichenis TaxID=1629072 RepID=UPI0027389FA0|nr:SelT/SelW/SelH family protein [Actinoplanes lichenis]
MTTRRPRLEIEYCTQCRWLLRAAWTAQELLTTFQKELGEVALIPGTGGIFDVRLDGELLWSRAASGHPELADLKVLVRDRIAPGRSLGHSDRAAASSDAQPAGRSSGEISEAGGAAHDGSA